MKNLLVSILFFLTLLTPNMSYSNEVSREQRLIQIMEKAIFCTVAYSYQLRFASIAVIIVPSNDPKVSIDALLSASKSWIIITETVQDALRDEYGHLQQYLSQYKDQSVQTLSSQISTEFITLIPDEFIPKLYNSTVGCPALAIEARDLLKDKSNSPEPDRIKPHTPKRKM